MTATSQEEEALGSLARLDGLRCAAVVVVVSVAKYGIGLFPSWTGMLHIALNYRHLDPTGPLTPPDDYLLSSPTSAIVAGLLGFQSDVSFLRFHLILVFVALVIPLAIPTVRRHPATCLAVALVVVGGPLPAILLSWTASYDAVTVIAGSIAALTVHSWLGVLGWTILAFNNAPQAALAFVVLALVMSSELGFPQARRVLAPGAAGVLIGVSAIQLLTSHWGAVTSRTGLLGSHLRGGGGTWEPMSCLRQPGFP